MSNRVPLLHAQNNPYEPIRLRELSSYERAADRISKLFCCPCYTLCGFVNVRYNYQIMHIFNGEPYEILKEPQIYRINPILSQTVEHYLGLKSVEIKSQDLGEFEDSKIQLNACVKYKLKESNNIFKHTHQSIEKNICDKTSDVFKNTLLDNKILDLETLDDVVCKIDALSLESKAKINLNKLINKELISIESFKIAPPIVYPKIIDSD
ncbi:MAG: hypothetical protein JHC93_03635 [Parachlamydiales bacterium]|nr:hypothetical protein [Parachlamydiales bacterium]